MIIKINQIIVTLRCVQEILIKLLNQEVIDSTDDRF